MRKITFGLFGLLLLSLVALAIGPSVAAQGQSFPKTIPLPNGFPPEGVAVGRGPVIFAGSLADGDIYRANLRAGVGEVLVQGPPTLRGECQVWHAADAWHPLRDRTGPPLVRQLSIWDRLVRKTPEVDNTSGVLFLSGSRGLNAPSPTTRATDDRPRTGRHRKLVQRE